MIKVTSQKGNVEVVAEGKYSEIMADTCVAVESIIDKMAKANNMSKEQIEADFVTAIMLFC